MTESEKALLILWCLTFAVALIYEWRLIDMKKFFIILICLLVAVSLAACNYQVIDTTWSYDRAIIQLPDGEVVDGEIKAWRDYEDGDQIQVKMDGSVYLVHSSDIVLYSCKEVDANA